MKYLTIDDVCDMLSISRRTLERMRQVKPGIGNVSSPLRVKKHDINVLLGLNLAPLAFPEPDLYIGRSPRWEQEKLITWLQKNGNRLQTPGE